MYCADSFKAEDKYTITLKGISEKNADVVRTVVATEEDLANGIISIGDVPPGYYEICESALQHDDLSIAPMYIFSRNIGYVPACSADATLLTYTTYGFSEKRAPRIVISIYGLDYSELLNYIPVVKSETSNWSATFTFYWHYPENDGARCGELYNFGSNGPMTDNCTVVFPEVPGFTMADAATQSHTTSENENRDMIFAMHYVKNTETPTTPTPTPGDEPTSKPGGTPSSKPGDEPSSKPSDEPSSKPGDEPTSKPGDKPSSTPGTEATPAPTPVPSTEPTPAPTSTPSAEPTPAPSAEAAAPVLTPAPVSTTAPVPNTTVRSTPAPSTKPTPSPTPTAKPTATPAPTAEPEPSATPDTVPSSAPTEQPEATPAPAEVKKESKRSMPFWVVPVAVPCVAVGGASFIAIFRRRWRK